MRFCYANVSSLSSFIWKRLTTPPGGAVSSEPCTAVISGAFHRCFYLACSRPDIFAPCLEIFRVRFISKKTEYHTSVLSVALFVAFINGLVNDVGPSVSKSLYVDDVDTYNISRSTVTIERWRQDAINRLSGRGRANGLRSRPT
jgi:hypothetical protein